MTSASQTISRHTFDDQPDFGIPDAWRDSFDLLGYAFRLPIDPLTTIVHKLIEVGGMVSDPLGVKDLLRRR